ncbi:hypothetical protein [Streptomyces sp. NPDC048659]|uniref:hypothetical protein n=1 Tax=Streptomyces sp. NPDC048659 TaxID=3155489 RepID=UPI003437742A
MTASGGGEHVNDYDGSCARCGGPVPAGAGVLRHEGRGWAVYHPAHAPAPGPPPRGEHPGWHRRPLLALDIGTTGHRPAVDRIRSASLRGADGTARDWTLDLGPAPEGGWGPDAGAGVTGRGAAPGVPGAPGTSAAPGAAGGSEAAGSAPGPLPPARALEELAGLVAGQLAAGEPLVVWFAPYVLGTLHAELLRHGLAPLTARLPRGVAPVCDPLVLDRHVDRHRPGGRSLRAVAAWYGVPHPDPGDPASDAAAALGVAEETAARHPSLARLSRPALHTEQILWYAEQTARHPDAPDWPFSAVAPEPWAPPPAN